MKRKIHVIPHTHWDREWYFSLSDSQTLGTFMFDEILKTLETQKEYLTFCLDGQVSILEDYLSIKPNNKDRIQKLAKQKRLLFGPWYTQSDSFYVTAESIIRNLKFGIEYANSLGHSMNIGYLPDTFGHNEQMPQIFSGFDINNIIFWRGIDFNIIKSPYFKWIAPDNSKIYAVNLNFGYGAAKWLTPKNEQFDKKIFPMVEKIKESTSAKNILLPSGGDQVLIDDKLPKIINELDKKSKDDKYFMSDYEKFIGALAKEKNAFQETYKGELREPKYTRIHRTIGSVRYDIKKTNFILENKLLKNVEPLLSLHRLISGKDINVEAYKQSWKYALDGHAHDSMGGCNTDITNSNIINRFNKGINIADGLSTFYRKNIGLSISDSTGYDLVVFNYDFNKRIELKELTLYSKYNNISIVDSNLKPVEIKYLDVVKKSGGKIITLTSKGEKEIDVNPYYEIKLVAKLELPSFGYNSYKIINNNKKLLNNKQIISKTGSKSIEIADDHYKVEIVGNNINILENMNNKLIKDAIKFEDIADCGDSYDFSPLESDNPILDFKLKNLKKTYYSNLKYSSIDADVVMKLPIGLSSNRKTRSLKHKNFIMHMEIRLKNDNLLHFKFNTLNNIMDHRFRVLLKTPIHSKSFYTDIPFGFKQRTIGVSKKISENWRNEYKEFPIDIFPIDKVAYINKNKLYYVLFTKGIKEIQGVIDSNLNKTTLALTLFKSHGFLGRDNLYWRPNRASGINNTIVPTPDAQLQKQLSFEFSIRIDSGLTETKILKTSNKYLETNQFYYQSQKLNTELNHLERFQMPLKNINIANNFDLIEGEPNVLSKFVVSSISPSTITKDAVLVRFINYGNAKVLNIKDIFQNYKTKSFVQFNEKKLEQKSKKINKYEAFTILIG